MVFPLRALGVFAYGQRREVIKELCRIQLWSTSGFLQTMLWSHICAVIFPGAWLWNAVGHAGVVKHKREAKKQDVTLSSLLCSSFLAAFERTTKEKNCFFFFHISNLQFHYTESATLEARRQHGKRENSQEENTDGDAALQFPRPFAVTS